MDIRMPVMNGLEATRLIRGAAEKSGISPPIIIALTASAFNEDRDAVLEAGCDDFVRRPFREAEILGKMAVYLHVEYHYETHSATSPSVSDRRGMNKKYFHEELSHLPRPLIEELKSAIELSDMEKMDQLVASIDTYNDDLAAGLKELLNAFQYDRVLSAIDELKWL